MRPRLSQEVDQARQRLHDASPEELVRLRQSIDVRLQQSRPWKRWVVLINMALTAAAVVIAVWLYSPSDSRWFEVEQGGDCVSIGNGGSSIQSLCTTVLRVEQDSVELESGTELVAEAQRLRLRRGKARFRVERRRRGQRPFRLRVSHGLVTVVGTRFDVEQHEGGGQLAVHRGRVTFQWDAGESQELGPGDSVRWPRPPATDETEDEVEETADEGVEQTDEIETPRSKSKQPRGARPSRVILEKLLLLRSQGQYEKAVRLLTGAVNDKRLSKEDRERFSYELGLLFESKLADVDRECAHWRKHARAFRRGRFAYEVERQLEHCP